MKCQYCKNNFERKQFKIKGKKDLSPYCPLCRDTAEIKDRERIAKENGNMKRDLTDHEKYLQRKFIKDLGGLAPMKLPISGGVL